MIIRADEAVRMANRVVRKYGTRNPERLAHELNIIVMPRNFVRQKGVYKVIKHNRFIFIKEDLQPVLYSIVLLHEIGHDLLHRAEAVQAGGFQEINLFMDLKDREMEYEANIFAAQVSLPDDEILEFIMKGYDVWKIAQEMESDANLVSLKIDELIRRGYRFQRLEYRGDFLK